MATTAIARRYASAFFELAREDNQVDSYGEDLTRAVDTLGNHDVAEALANPRLDVADRVRLALDLTDGIGEKARNLVRLLVERNRIAALPEVLERYNVLADRASGVTRAVVTTAVDVSSEVRDAIAEALRTAFGGTVSIEHRTDPAIIGGLVVRAGDRVIDNSIRTHLEQLQASLR